MRMSFTTSLVSLFSVALSSIREPDNLVSEGVFLPGKSPSPPKHFGSGSASAPNPAGLEKDGLWQRRRIGFLVDLSLINLHVGGSHRIKSQFSGVMYPFECLIYM